MGSAQAAPAGGIDSPAAAAAAAVPTAADARCANCGAGVAGNYCAHCGQETTIETPTVRQFVHELMDQYVAVEGKLGRTLRVLLTSPGQLTLDYLEGRRQRYVRPLKLYVSVTVVFFGLLGALPDWAPNPLVQVDPQAEKQGLKDLQHPPAAAAPVQPAAPAPPQAAAPAPAQAEPGDTLGEQIKREVEAGIKQGDTADVGSKIKGDVDADLKKEFGPGIGGKLGRFAKLPRDQQSRLLRARLADQAPYAMFFLLPYFAFLLRLLYRKHHLRYGVHLLFAVHLHCFAFILLMLGFLPLPAILHTGLKWAIAAYLFLALQRVYGGTWQRTLWREALLYAFYIAAIGATALSGVISTVLGT